MDKGQRNTSSSLWAYSIELHVNVLAEKSLIELNSPCWEYYDVILHDLIEDMGKEIVRQESCKEPGERSRLWHHDDIIHVLQESRGTKNIEMIYLNSPSMENGIDNVEAFKTMTALNTLIIKNCRFSESPICLPSTLKVLIWERYPLQSLSSSIFSQKLDYMIILTLDKSQYLTHIPDVSGLQNLERFSFEDCCNLVTIDSSIGKLIKLESLSAKGCRKLKNFPPLHLPSLKNLELSECNSLKSFPELLCKMTNINMINFCDTSIEESPFSLPFSFQYLSELEYLQINRVRMLRFPKYNDRMNPFSKINFVILGETNLSDECLPILLKWFVNVRFLNLSENNFKILPECLSECHHLEELVLDDCKFLEEIRGFPPNLRKFNAVGCVSLSLESRRRLLSQDQHDAGCTQICFPNGSEGIPDWFEHQSSRHTVSFWFSKKIPTITCIFLIPGSVWPPKINLFLNGKELYYPRLICSYLKVLPSEHAVLCDLDLHSHIYGSFALYNAFKNNEWNRVELKWEVLNSGAQMGIHVSWYGYDWSDTEYDDFYAQIRKEKSNKEGEVRFIKPYSRKRKIDEDINEEERKMWGTFLGLGASKSNTDGDEIEILTSAQNERNMWGTFLSLGPSLS